MENYSDSDTSSESEFDSINGLLNRTTTDDDESQDLTSQNLVNTMTNIRTTYGIQMPKYRLN